MPTPDLYEHDFVAWAQAQAEALRVAGRAGGRSNAVEWERVAEELEDLGKSEYRAAASFALQILAHLYKLTWTQQTAPKGAWRAEILTFRASLARTLTPTLRNRLAAELETLHVQAAAVAAATFDTHEPDAPRDVSLRWSLEAVLGEVNDPLTLP